MNNNVRQALDGLYCYINAMTDKYGVEARPAMLEYLKTIENALVNNERVHP